MPKRLTDGEFAALARFRAAMRGYFHAAEVAARDVGLTAAQHQLLLAVRGTTPDLPPSVSELSRSLYLKVHSTMGLIARAERAGLVHTWTDDRDARRQLVAITAKGARLIALLYESHKRELLGARGELLDALRHLDER